MRDLAITLIGPGAAGKSTVALLLAERLGIRAVDLDRLFAERAGDISEYINRFGYDVYARHNVEIYRLMLQEETDGTVTARAPAARPAVCPVSRSGRSSDQSAILTLRRSTASNDRDDEIIASHC